MVVAVSYVVFGMRAGGRCRGGGCRRRVPSVDLDELLRGKTCGVWDHVAHIGVRDGVENCTGRDVLVRHEAAEAAGAAGGRCLD